MLKVNHIQKNYSHFNLNCSFDVPKGTITGIIGKRKAVQEKQPYLNLF